MKRSFVVSMGLAVIGVMACQIATAQDKSDSLKFYGIFDLGYGSQTNGLAASPSFAASIDPFDFQRTANPNSGTHSGFFNGPLSDPRLGLTGRKVLGSDWLIGFNVESGFDVTSAQFNNHAKALDANAGANASTAAANSSLNGQLFNRSAYVSLVYANAGELRVGRNNSFALDAFAAFDPVQNAQAFSLFGFSGGYGGGMGASDNARQDNSLKYQNKKAGFDYGLMYEAGNGTGVLQQGHGAGLMAGWSADSFKIRTVYQTATDAIVTGLNSAAGATSGIRASTYNTSGYLVALDWAASPAWKFKTGIERFTLSAPTDTVAAPSSLYGYTVTNFATPAYAGTDQNRSITWVGASYAFSDQIKLYSGLYNVKLASYLSNASDMTSTKTAVTNNYTSLLLDYNLTLDKDVYMGLLRASFGGTTGDNSSINAGGYSSSRTMAAGFRYKF